MRWSAIVFSKIYVGLVAVLAATALLPGCVTRPVTTVEMSWVTPQLPQAPFKQLLIISVARDDFVQVAFQDQLAAALKARGINAVASKAYFTIDTDAARARFKQTIEASGADYVLMAHVTGRDKKSRDDRFMTFGDATGFYTGYDRYVSSARSASDYSSESMTSEVSIFRVEGQRLIWSARIRTDNPKVMIGEDYAPLYVAVVLDAMKKDKLL